MNHLPAVLMTWKAGLLLATGWLALAGRLPPNHLLGIRTRRTLAGPGPPGTSPTMRRVRGSSPRGWPTCCSPPRCSPVHRRRSPPRSAGWACCSP
ncbi:hypothetical protein [Actinomadura sp. 9N215]|uniref:hypothetical protein n=1 Tax=Actinomadura sp. 9N215 TaxID=3375150 RepID=UPI0037ACF820